MVANGIDPGEQKRLAKAARIAATGDTFEPIASTLRERAALE